MNTRLFVLLLFGVIVLAGLFVKKINFGIRVGSCLVLSLACSVVAVTGSLAPHRMAEAKAARLGETPSAEWIKGALATRDEVYPLVIFWLLPLAVLSVLCIYLLSQKSRKDLSG